MLLTSLFSVLSEKQENSANSTVDILQIAFFCCVCRCSNIHTLISQFLYMNEIDSVISWDSVMSLFHSLIKSVLFIQYPFLFVAYTCRTSSCPFAVSKLDFLFTQLLHSMDISPQDSLLSKDVFHVLADNVNMFLPLNVPVKYPSIASPAVDQTNELIEGYNRFETALNEFGEKEQERYKTMTAAFVQTKAILKIMTTVYANSKNIPQGVKDLVNLEYADVLKLVGDEKKLQEIVEPEKSTENIESAPTDEVNKKAEE